MNGGLWENTSGTTREFHLGWNRDGTLEMTGGTIDKYRWFVGNNATMNVSGGTINSSNPFRLGGGNNLSYTPVLNLSGTGEINLGGGAHFYGAGGGSNGVVNQSGGTFNMAGSFQAGNTANSEFTYNLSGGELKHTHHEFYLANALGVTAKINIAGGVLDTNASIVHQNNANAVGEVTISSGRLIARNNVNFNADAAGASGTFKVSGSGATEITIHGQLQVTNGNTLAFELDNNGAAAIVCGNLADLRGGRIQINTRHGFYAPVGTEFDLLHSDDVIDGVLIDHNTFLENISPYFIFEIDIKDKGVAGSTLVARVSEISISSCEDVFAAGLGNPADINQDCIVDLKDFAILAAEWLNSDI